MTTSHRRRCKNGSCCFTWPLSLGCHRPLYVRAIQEQLLEKMVLQALPTYDGAPMTSRIAPLARHFPCTHSARAVNNAERSLCNLIYLAGLLLRRLPLLFGRLTRGILQFVLGRVSPLAASWSRIAYSLHNPGNLGDEMGFLPLFNLCFARQSITHPHRWQNPFGRQWWYCKHLGIDALQCFG